MHEYKDVHEYEDEEEDEFGARMPDRGEVVPVARFATEGLDSRLEKRTRVSRTRPRRTTPRTDEPRETSISRIFRCSSQFVVRWLRGIQRGECQGSDR